MGQFWLRRSWQQAAHGLSQGDPLGARHGHLDEVVEAAQVVADEGRVSIERLTGTIASGAAIVEALAAKMPAEAKPLSVDASREACVVTKVFDSFARLVELDSPLGVDGRVEHEVALQWRR